MRKKQKTTFFVGFAVFILTISIVAFSSSHNSTLEGSLEMESDLTLAFSPDKSSFVAAEPILIRLNLSNQTPAPIQWKGLLMLGPNVNFTARATSGEQIVWKGSDYATGLIGSSTRVLEPGGEVLSELLLDGSVVEILFPQPGQYELQVEFVYSTGPEERDRISVKSNAVGISIMQPDMSERQALDFLRGPLEDARRQTDNRVLAQRQQEFVDRFATSTYAKYVVFQLANNYVSLGENRNAAREICKLAGQDFFYKKAVEKKIYELEAKLRPFAYPAGLPENAPLPERPHPCSRMLN